MLGRLGIGMRIPRIAVRARTAYLRNFSRTARLANGPVNGATNGAVKGKRTMKDLVKEYGYSALGVYFALSMIDLPILYLAVHSMGKEKIESYENTVKNTFGYGVTPEELAAKQAERKAKEEAESASDTVSEVSENRGIWKTIYDQFSFSEFIIAYGIHKSLIFIRLPITAAITPGIVKVLRGWGFKIGSQSVTKTAQVAKETIKDFTASNPKFGTRPGKRKWWWFF